MGFDLNMVVPPRFQVAQGEWRTSGEGISQLLDLMAYVEVLDIENEPEDGPDWPEGMDEARAEALAEWLRFEAALDAPATPEEEASARAWLARTRPGAPRLARFPVRWRRGNSPATRAGM